MCNSMLFNITLFIIYILLKIYYISQIKCTLVCALNFKPEEGLE